MKKILAVLLAAMMCASLLLACGGSQNSETTKSQDNQESTTKESDSKESEDTGKADEPAYKAYMTVGVGTDNWPHLDEVMDRLKEITLRDINIELNCIPLTVGAMSQQIPLMLAGQDQLDIVYAQGDPMTNYENAYIIDMMPYWDQLKDTIEIVGGEDEVKASLRDGHLLGFSPQLERAHHFGFCMRTDILNEVGYTEDDLKDCDFDQVTEIFKAVHEKYPEMTVLGGNVGVPPATNFNHTHALGANNMGVLDNYGEELKVVNAYETPEFIKRVNYAKQWFDAGYMQKDLATAFVPMEPVIKAGSTFAGGCAMKPDSAAEKTDQCGYDMTIFNLSYDMVNAYNGSGYAIGGTSKDPEKAVKLMNYIFTSREFNDTINWGIEGVDWVESDDPSHNVATYPEGMNAENQTYHNSLGWLYPNQRVAHVWDNNDPEMYTKIYPETEAAAKRSKAYGFQFVNTDWVDAEGAFSNIVSEYLYSIAAGSEKDPEAKMKEFNDKLYASGLKEYMAAQQAQLDEWAKANNIQ